jgi:hypothetical protein
MVTLVLEMNSLDMLRLDLVAFHSCGSISHTSSSYDWWWWHHSWVLGSGGSSYSGCSVVYNIILPVGPRRGGRVRRAKAKCPITKIIHIIVTSGSTFLMLSDLYIMSLIRFAIAYRE